MSYWEDSAALDKPVVDVVPDTDNPVPVGRAAEPVEQIEHAGMPADNTIAEMEPVVEPDRPVPIPFQAAADTDTAIVPAVAVKPPFVLAAAVVVNTLLWLPVVGAAAVEKLLAAAAEKPIAVVCCVEQLAVAVGAGIGAGDHARRGHSRQWLGGVDAVQMPNTAAVPDAFAGINLTPPVIFAVVK